MMVHDRIRLNAFLLFLGLCVNAQRPIFGTISAFNPYMNIRFTHFRLLSLSIVLTLALLSCGRKTDSNSFSLRYDESGLILSSLVIDSAPVNIQSEYIPGHRLLSTSWGQSSPFNSTLPLIDDQKPVVGCVNSALGQFLYYYRQNLKTQGVFHGRLLNSDTWADLETPINWQLIPEQASAVKQIVQSQEVGQLFKNMAVINKTNLATAAQGGSASNASIMVQNLIKYFGFSNEIKEMSTLASDFDSNLESLLINEIRKLRPVFLSTTGSLNHLIIIDGYKIENGQALFHLNLGWSGLHDGFYPLDKAFKVKEEFEKDGSLWERNLVADQFTFYFNIKLCNDHCFNNLEVSDTLENNQIQGEFLNSFDEDTFGPFNATELTQIQLNRWENGNYFISIIDQYGRVIKEENNQFSFSSKQDFYIRLSPRSYVSNQYFPNIGKYKLFVDSIVSNKAESLFEPATLNLSVSHQLLPLHTENILRFSTNTFLPKDIQYSVIHPDINEEYYRTSNNLITFNSQLFKANKLYKVMVQVKVGAELIDSKQISLIKLDDNIVMGPSQELSGRFKSKDDQVDFKSILKGNCHFSGDRGFSNQGFFVSFDDSAHHEGSFNQELELGLYSIKATLKSGGESYPFDEKMSDFKISIDCTNSDYDPLEIERIVDSDSIPAKH